MSKKTKGKVTLKPKTDSSFRKTHTYILFFSLFAVLFLFVITGLFAFFPELRPFHIPCANSRTCLGDVSGKILSAKGSYLGKQVTGPDQTYFAQSGTQVLGAAIGGGQKHIYIDLALQRLFAYQGSTMVFNDSVATGKWNLTPTGTFQLWIKLQATLMAGGEGATSYYLPNVPWTMFFSNAKVPRSAGYSLHGEYWYNPDIGLGKPQSHGCINMRISDAKALYDWADPATTGTTTRATDTNPGTLVTIYGITPNDGLVGTQFYNNNISPNTGATL